MLSVLTRNGETLVRAHFCYCLEMAVEMCGYVAPLDR